jgi:ATP-dependent Clp protease adaptor protein ClpS
LKYANHFSIFEVVLKLGMNTSVQEQELIDVLEVIETIELKDLVVFNDDVNTFEHVINTLIRVCKHTPEQAEQCTWIIHYKGKCKVKTGTYEELRPMKDAICEAGIDAKIV